MVLHAAAWVPSGPGWRAFPIPGRLQPVPGDPAMRRRIDLLGVPFDVLRERELIAHVIGESRAGRGGWVVTPNLDILRQCAADPAIHTLVSRAEIVVADGTPLLLASWLQGTPLPERVRGSSLIHTLADAAAGAGLQVFFLGGNPGTAERCAERLQARWPGLLVAGTACPAFGFEADASEQARIQAEIVAARPDLVLVALSFPKGERLIQQLRHATPGAWWVGVGISFSYVAGEVQHAPAWLRRLGLEWLFRLAQEPRRLARRYLVLGVPFFARLLFAALRTRFREATSRVP